MLCVITFLQNNEKKQQPFSQAKSSKPIKQHPWLVRPYKCCRNKSNEEKKEISSVLTETKKQHQQRTKITSYYLHNKSIKIKTSKKQNSKNKNKNTNRKNLRKWWIKQNRMEKSITIWCTEHEVEVNFYVQANKIDKLCLFVCLHWKK